MQEWSDYIGPAIALILAAVARTLPSALKAWARSRLENRRLFWRAELAKHTHKDPGFVSGATPPHGTPIPPQLLETDPEEALSDCTHEHTETTPTATPTTTNPTGRKKSLAGGRRER